METTEPGTLAGTYNPNAQKLREEDCWNFKARLGYEWNCLKAEEKWGGGRGRGKTGYLKSGYNLRRDIYSNSVVFQ